MRRNYTEKLVLKFVFSSYSANHSSQVYRQDWWYPLCVKFYASIINQIEDRRRMVGRDQTILL